MKDRARSGSPTSITTTRMRKVIRSRILRNPRKSMRKMSSELGISRSSVLGLSSYKLRRVHFLSDKIKQKRLVRSKGLIQRFAICGLENILFSDEKLFTIEQAYNHQNDRVLSPSSCTIPDEPKDNSITGLGWNFGAWPHPAHICALRGEN